MYRKYGNWMRSVLFLSILLMLLMLASFVVRPKRNREEDGISNPRIYGFLSERENTVDVLVLGDSLSCTSYNPMEVWRDHGFTSYVCGKAMQIPLETEELAEQFCERQSPKIIFMEVNPLFTKTEWKDVLVNRAERLLPVFRYHDHWKTLHLYDFYDRERFTEKSVTKGYRASVTKIPSRPGDYMKPGGEAEPIAPLNRRALGKLADFCREREIDLYLYSAPNSWTWNYRRHEAVSRLAEELGLKFFDMNRMTEEIPVDWGEDSFDGGDHLNYSGSQKVTAWMGQFLENTGVLTDRREDPAFACWNDALGEYDAYMAGLSPDMDLPKK